MALPRSGGGIMPPVYNEAAPAPDVTNRLIISESYLSLVVQNVRDTTNKIIDFAKNNGGYMVNSSLNNPGETTSATVTVRIPANKLDSTLETFRSLAVKVVSENLTGTDVTDQYVDIQSRLNTLLKTKAKFEDILDKAVNVQDILNVQREIINLQSQIDSYKGQEQYFEKSAQMAKLTVYLSTDELALPYAPDEGWRPSVIFKLAVRSLVSNIRGIGTMLIWLAVYAIVWIPLLAIAVFIYKRKKKFNVS